MVREAAREKSLETNIANNEGEENWKKEEQIESYETRKDEEKHWRENLEKGFCGGLEGC